MPNVTTAVDIDKDTIGFGFLGQSNQKCGLIFSGSTLATTVEVGTLNDQGTFVAFDDGAVTSLPRSMVVNSVNNDKGIVINVDGGSPNFNISHAGASGPTKP